MRKQGKSECCGRRFDLYPEVYTRAAPLHPEGFRVPFDELARQVAVPVMDLVLARWRILQKGPWAPGVGRVLE